MIPYLFREKRCSTIPKEICGKDIGAKKMVKKTITKTVCGGYEDKSPGKQ